MSLANSSSSGKKADGPYRKPRPDIYTVLLAIALVALLLGILFLYLELNTYEFKLKGGPMVRAAEPPASAVATVRAVAATGYRPPPAAFAFVGGSFPLTP